MKQRNSYIDTLKTILIFLVVFGHCLIRLGEDNSLIHTLLVAIYSVHMPLFVFVSGYLSRPEKTLRKSCAGLLSAFILFQIIWTFINPPHSVSKLLSPAVTLWYLLSLCYWRVMIHVLNKVCQNKVVWFCISLLLMIIAGYVPLTNELAFQRTFSFFPFFVMGCLVKDSAFLMRIRSINRYISVIVLLGVLIVFFIIQPDVMWLLFGRASFYKYHTSMWIAPFVKLLWLVVTSLISVLFLSIIAETEWLANEGSKTLTIYLFHFFPIYFSQKLGFVTGDLLLLIVIATGIYVITSLMHNLKFIRYMTCPIH